MAFGHLRLALQNDAALPFGFFEACPVFRITGRFGVQHQLEGCWSASWQFHFEDRRYCLLILSL
jgi:hypothetical protein